MRADTFKTWLRKKGCRFDSREHDRGKGHASLTIKLGDKRSTLPLVGTHRNISVTDVSRILHDLNLPAQELPGPAGETGLRPGERHNGFLSWRTKAASDAARKGRNTSAET